MLRGGAGGVMDSNAGAVILLSNFHSMTRLPRLSLPLKLKNWRFIHSGVVLVKKSRVRRCSYGRWDSNAENVGFGDKNDDVEEEEVGNKRKRKIKRKWMADKPPNFDDDEEEEGLLEEFLDGFWVVKVVKSYGWAMPPILISWLLASGPKAWLLVLAIPFGQSVVTFVLSKLFGEPKKKTKPKRNVRKKRRPFRGSVIDSEMDDEEIDEKPGNVKGKMGFQSWVSDDNGAAATDGNRQDEPQFGGWDDFEEVKSAQRQTPRMPGRTRRKTSENAKLGMSARRSGAPLLLRLLIAVFPFLGSWTKLL